MIARPDLLLLQDPVRRGAWLLARCVGVTDQGEPLFRYLLPRECYWRPRVLHQLFSHKVSDDASS